MEHLIDKSALVAEIKRLRDTAFELYGCSQFDSAYNNVLKSIDTLEVKEVDLQSEIDRAWDNTSDNFSEDGWKEFEDIAKHFFELGMAASNKAQKGE